LIDLEVGVLCVQKGLITKIAGTHVPTKPQDRVDPPSAVAAHGTMSTFLFVQPAQTKSDHDDFIGEAPAFRPLAKMIDRVACARAACAAINVRRRESRRDFSCAPTSAAPKRSIRSLAGCASNGPIRPAVWRTPMRC
jgi:hypothetical protein